MRKICAGVLITLLVVTLGQSVHGGAAYPTQPILFIAPASPGGGWDQTARALAKVLQETSLVPVPITVTNMPGGSGTVALTNIATTKRGEPYTLAVFSPSLVLQLAHKRVKLGVKDFTPLASLTADFGVLAVRKESPYKDLRSYLQVLGRNPSAISIAGGSAMGGQSHIGAALMLKSAGLDPTKMRYVAYQGDGDAMLALLGGHVDSIFVSISGVISQLEAEQVNVLAIFADKQLGPPFTQVPVGKEQGVPLVFPIWRGMYMPPGVDKAHVMYWDGVFRKLRDTSAWKDTLKRLGWLDNYMGPEEFKGFVEKELRDYETVLKELGVL